MKIYETPIINVEKFYEEDIVTSSSQAVDNVKEQIAAVIPEGNRVEAVETLRWVY